MPDATILFNITPVPFLSVLVWIFLCIAAMYFARRPFHDAMQSLGRVIYNAMRTAAASVKIAHQRLEARNREVLLSAGMDHAERRIDHRPAGKGFRRRRGLCQRRHGAWPGARGYALRKRQPPGHSRLAGDACIVTISKGEWAAVLCGGRCRL